MSISTNRGWVFCFELGIHNSTRTIYHIINIIYLQLHCYMYTFTIMYMKSNQMVSAIILAFFLCFPWHGMGTKVFTFHEGSSVNDELSSATLINAPAAPLPDHFVICSSHKQQQIGTRNTGTIYALYEDSSFSKPWFSVQQKWFNTVS